VPIYTSPFVLVCKVCFLGLLKDVENEFKHVKALPFRHFYFYFYYSFLSFFSSSLDLENPIFLFFHSVASDFLSFEIYDILSFRTGSDNRPRELNSFIHLFLRPPILS
jgi:hypothetical protein